MSSATPIFEVGAVALGYVGMAATWRRAASAEERHRRDPMLIIHTCADTDEGVHTPAQSVTINSRVGLLALRAAVDEALKEPVSAAIAQTKESGS